MFGLYASRMCGVSAYLLCDSFKKRSPKIDERKKECECFRILFSNTFEPFHHCEHYAHGNKANDKEHRPCLPDGEFVVHQRANPEKQIANGRCAKPKALAKALHVLGSHFRHERKSERRDEKLCDSEEEIEKDEYPRTCFHGCHRIGIGESLGTEFGARRIALIIAVNGKEKVSDAGKSHTDSDFTRS